MSEKYRIKSLDELYFVTFSTVNWIDVFTRNEYKDIFLESLRFCQEKKDMDLHAYCLMTNHAHLIVSTRGRPLPETIRDMKQFTAKRILKAIQDNLDESRKDWMLWMFARAGRKIASNEIYQFWQHHSHPIELFTPEMTAQKLDYIHDNPVKAGFVNNPCDWTYSSARKYHADEKLPLDIILIE